jgi:hypothetical protein
MKALRVVVVMEFENITDADGVEADVLLDTMDTDIFKQMCGANSVWIDDAFVVNDEEV